MQLPRATRLLSLYALPARPLMLFRPMRAFSTMQFDKDLDYYRALGLQKAATQAEIKRKFYELAKKHHPDSAESKPDDEEKFKKKLHLNQTN